MAFGGVILLLRCTQSSSRCLPKATALQLAKQAGCTWIPHHFRQHHTRRADGEVTLASYGASVSLRSTTGSHVARSSVLSEVMNSTQVSGHVQERH